MNILTKNRILQKGDEYRNNGTWKPVPVNDYGLQIMFTKYEEVRRPSEKPFPVSPTTPSNESHPAPTARKVQTSEGVKRSPSPDNPESGRETSSLICENPEAMTEFMRTISPDSEKPEAAHVQPSAIVTAKAEKEKTPAPTPSGAGESLNVKAKLVPMTPEQLAIQAGAGASPCITNIIFPPTDPTSILDDPPIWTGRNGTFTGYGLDLMRIENRVALSPVGKRGVGNCTIQFPVSVIPQIVEWLNGQHKNK